MLPKSLLYALGETSRASGLRIFFKGDYEEKSNRMLEVSKIIRNEYLDFIRLVEKEDGDCDEAETCKTPFDDFLQLTDYGLLCPLEPLILHREDGTIITTRNGAGAIEQALKSIKKRFPDVEYDGHASYYWTDSSNEGFEQFAFFSADALNDPNKAYDFTGKYLKLWCMKNQVFWGRLQKGVTKYQDHDELIEVFNRYSEWTGDYIEQAKSLKDS